MNFEVNGSVLTIFPEGRIDTTTAPINQAEFDSICAANPHASVVVDFSHVEYISSAGLRFILAEKKKEKALSLINVSGDVYDVFEMTGFTEMMEIKKAYRVLQVEGCEVIGEGANGKVYRINPDTIVKVYLNPDSLPDIHRERELAKRAFVLGVPTAISYDVVRVGNGYGSVFELLNAKPLNRWIVDDPENIDKYIQINVDLLKTIHSTVVREGDMPSQKAVAVDWANMLKDYLPAEIGAKLVSLMNAIPEDYHMMHGDYHVKNVMLQNGEALLIDMDTLCHGHPIFELASMFNAYVGFKILSTDPFNSFMGMPMEVCHEIWNKSLRLYLKGKTEEEIQAISEKAEIIGYTRIARRSIRRHGLEDPVEKANIDYAINRVIELVKKHDSLVY